MTPAQKAPSRTLTACKYACKPEKLPFWQATANITQGKNKKGKFLAEFCLTHCKDKIELL